MYSFVGLFEDYANNMSCTKCEMLQLSIQRVLVQSAGLAITIKKFCLTLVAVLWLLLFSHPLPKLSSTTITSWLANSTLNFPLDKQTECEHHRQNFRDWEKYDVYLSRRHLPPFRWNS